MKDSLLLRGLSAVKCKRIQGEFWGFQVILTGWKEIANHLRYGVRTVQRWEREGLPVSRVTDSLRAPVVADSEQLDSWVMRHKGASPTSDYSQVRQQARKLRTEVKQSRETLHLRMAHLREEMASLHRKQEKGEKGLSMKDSSSKSDPEKAEMEFLRTELFTGLTLSKIARNSKYGEKRDRNRMNARKAYDSLIHYMPRANSQNGEWQNLESKMEQLKSELQELGEEI